jgi:2-oxo-3-(phosphooxy)propyl 3-oxoalkanoate synthase
MLRTDDRPRSARLLSEPRQHLVHRPLPADLVTGLEGHRFVLSGRLPRQHALFTDDTAGLHDLHFVTEALRRVSSLVAARYLRVPAGEALAVRAADVVVTDLAAWARSEVAAEAVMDLVLVPRADREVDCEAALSIDGAPCCTATARLGLSRPSPVAAGAHPGSFEAPIGPLAEASRVGRASAENVLISVARQQGPDRLTVDLDVRLAGPAFGSAAAHVPGTVLVEGTRQAAILAAGELRGLCTSHCAPVRWRGALAHRAVAGVPLVCAATVGRPAVDAAGRPAVDVALELSQRGTAVGSVTVSVVASC